MPDDKEVPAQKPTELSDADVEQVSAGGSPPPPPPSRPWNEMNKHIVELD